MNAPRQSINVGHGDAIPSGAPTNRERAEATAQLLGKAAPLSAESQAVMPPAEPKPRPKVKVTGLPAPAAPDPYEAVNKSTHLRRPSQKLQPLPPGSVVLDREGWKRVKRMIDTHPDVIAARERDDQ